MEGPSISDDVCTGMSGDWPQYRLWYGVVSCACRRPAVSGCATFSASGAAAAAAAAAGPKVLPACQMGSWR
jgi:hypothetical protein